MKSKKFVSVILSMILVLTLVVCLPVSALAAETDTQAAQTETVEAAEVSGNDVLKTKALAAAMVVGISATAGAISMGVAISKSAESMARQPEASGKINSAMMLGLVFIETLIIYALIVAILIIFVL